MSEILPTIIVEGEGGVALLINLSDYDKNEHKIFGEEVCFDREAAILFLASKNVKHAKNIPDNKLEKLYEQAKKTLSVVEIDDNFIIIDGEKNQIGTDSFNTKEEAELMLEIFTG